MTESITPRPTIQIPRSLFIEYGQEIDAHKNWKTLRVSAGTHSDAVSTDHIIHLNHILGIGCQGTVYDADSNHYGNVVVKELKLPDAKGVKEISISDEVYGEIHYIASDLGIGPDVYDICVEDNKLYIVFEKLNRMVSFKDMCDPTISYQVCECITRLIENGIFHNDIRSTNIMLTHDNQVRLIDYDMSVQAFGPSEYDSATIIPYITAKEYDENLKKNYIVYLDEKKYVIAFPYEMQERHQQARDRFADLLVRSFILGVGYD